MSTDTLVRKDYRAVICSSSTRLVIETFVSAVSANLLAYFEVVCVFFITDKVININKNVYIFLLFTVKLTWKNIFSLQLQLNLWIAPLSCSYRKFLFIWLKRKNVLPCLYHTSLTALLLAKSSLKYQYFTNKTECRRTGRFILVVFVTHAIDNTFNLIKKNTNCYKATSNVISQGLYEG